MFVDLRLQVFETVHDDVKVVEKGVLVEDGIDFEGDGVLERDLGEFIHVLNIFIGGFNSTVYSL